MQSVHCTILHPFLNFEEDFILKAKDRGSVRFCALGEASTHNPDAEGLS